jgi:hypothetical protein
VVEDGSESESLLLFPVHVMSHLFVGLHVVSGVRGFMENVKDLL